MVTLLQLINHVGNDFDVSRMEISALKTSLALDSQKNSKTQKLEALLEEDQSQTQEEHAESLGVTQQVVPVRLRAMGMIQKQGNWVPCELKPRDVKKRFFTYEQLIQRQQRKGFLHRIVNGDEKGYSTTTPRRKNTTLSPVNRCHRPKHQHYG